MIPTTMIEFECSNGSRYSEPVHRRFSVIRQNDDGCSTILFHSDFIDNCWEYKNFHHPNNHSVYIAKRDSRVLSPNRLKDTQPRAGFFYA